MPNRASEAPQARTLATFVPFGYATDMAISRITVDPAVCTGEPCIRGVRFPVARLLGLYIAGFSPNMREVLEKFDFDNTISKLDEARLLFKMLERFKNVDLHPDKIDNPTMGTIFEELIRKFNEALNENPGEHFTPRDVVHLMVNLMLAGDTERIRRKESYARSMILAAARVACC
jgi:uncharacterized protein (DUF433 family)